MAPVFIGFRCGGLFLQRELFLKVGSEAREIQDMRQTGTGDAAASGQIGLRLEAAAYEELVDVDRNRHHS